MSCPFSEQQLTQLQAFIELCKTQPQILNHPKLSFFKDYLVSLGVTIPTATFGTKHFTPSGDGKNKPADAKVRPSSEESGPESDVDLDMEGVIEGDAIDDNQVMGDPDKELSDEDRDQSNDKRTEAMQAFSAQNYELAIKLYGEAILLNPQSSLLFAKRGQVFLKLNKPNACIKDCTRALELNCDSATAYKFRGRAYRLLGKFEEACHDLCESLKIDYDDQTNDWLNDVKPNAEKLRQHKLNVQRRREGKEHRDKMRRFHNAQEARCRATKAQAQAQAKANAMSGAGTAYHSAGGFSPNDFGSLLNDPEILATFQDPEVMTAFTDLSSNPGNFSKYQNNPKIAAAIQKLQTKLGKGGSMPFSGGFPGFGGAGAGGPGGPGGPAGPGGAAGPGAGPKQSTDDDVGLD